MTYTDITNNLWVSYIIAIWMTLNNTVPSQETKKQNEIYDNTTYIN